MAITLDASEIKRIDCALQAWRQGDAVIDGDIFMVHLADQRHPLTEATRAAAADFSDEYTTIHVPTSVRGLVVLSQTCDIVRTCVQSHFVELCELVRIKDEKQLQEIQKGRRSRYAYLPELADKHLVADLDRTVTAEKAVLAGWSRVEGCATDEERVAFAAALARKRHRFAFPNGFNTGLRKFRDNIKDKHGRDSSEGRLVDAIKEIRVQPDPGWGADVVKVFFWFLLYPDTVTDFATAFANAEKWMNRIKFESAFSLQDPAFSVVEPKDMTVEDYLTSFPLDYDDVSP